MDKKYYRNYWKNKLVGYQIHDLNYKIAEMIDQNYNNNCSVLEIGCGRGDLLKNLSDKGFTALSGCDIDSGIIKKAKSICSIAKLFVCNLESNKDTQKKYDLIVAVEVIEHIFNCHKFIQFISKHLDTNGEVIITTPHHGIIKNILISLFNFDKHFDIIGSHIRFFSLKSLKDIFHKQKFEIKNVIYYGRTSIIAKSMIVTFAKNK